MTTREFKSIPRLKYTARVTIHEETTHDPAQNGYGDVKEAARPKDSERNVLDIHITADTLEKLQDKVVAHVELAE